MNAATSEAAAAGSKPLTLKELHSRMALIRAFETRVAELYRDGEIPGFVHTSLGQEAVAAGVCAALRDDDYLATTHRGHGHCLAKGVDVDGMMAELFAGGDRPLPRQGRLDARRRSRARDPRRQRDRRRQPAARRRRRRCRASCSRQGRVAVAFFGEGAVNQGAFHEAVNLAAIWDLPVLFVCENNVYAEFSDSRTDDARAGRGRARAAGYGVDADAGRRQRRRAPSTRRRSPRPRAAARARARS